MKLTKIFAASALAISFFTSLAVAQSNWPRGAPTAEQIKEFFSQIQSGRITKETLGVFLGGDKIAGYESARRILGKDFITPEEVAAASHALYDEDKLAYFARTLPAKNTLIWAKKNGYAVVAVPPILLSLLDLYSWDVSQMRPDPIFAKQKWYANENFARNDRVPVSWLIIRKKPVPNSFGKNWNEQLRLLSKNDRVPNAGEISWFIKIFYEVRGIRLFESVYVRTSSVDSFGARVYAGSFDSNGLNIYSRSGDDRRDSLGLASARKF